MKGMVWFNCAVVVASGAKIARLVALCRDFIHKGLENGKSA